jgi:hypothetical protein
VGTVAAVGAVRARSTTIGREPVTICSKRRLPHGCSRLRHAGAKQGYNERRRNPKRTSEVQVLDPMPPLLGEVCMRGERKKLEKRERSPGKASTEEQ